MNEFAPMTLLATVATFSLLPAAVHAQAATVCVTAGKKHYGSNDQRIAAIYRVTNSGVAQVIFDGKMYTIPTASLSVSRC